jgi:hypothetical protein
MVLSAQNIHFRLACRRALRGRSGRSSRGWRCMKIQVRLIALGYNRAASDTELAG